MRGPGPPPEVQVRSAAPCQERLQLCAESYLTVVMHEQFVCLFERSLHPGVWETAIKAAVELPDTPIGLANDPPKE